MDPFTQRMLEKAEQRSRALGISNASKFQMSDCASGQSTGSGGDDAVSNPALTTQWQKPQQKQPSAHRSPMKTSTHVSTNTASSNKQLQVVEKKVAKEVVVAGNSSSSGLSPSKILRQFSAVNKENMDLGIEINIMMDKNVEVEVHVEEQSTTTDDDDDSNRPRQQQQERITESINQPTAKIRDTSRNHLQRLGALYSKPDDLSSPIHRTEGKFCAEDTSELSPKKPKQRYGKLAALANSINQWEDDITPHHASVTTTTTKTSSVPPPKPDLPSRRLAQQQQKQRAPEPPTQTSTDSTASTATMQHSNTATGTKPKQAEKKAVETSTSSSSSSVQSKTKQLKWDPHVINSLEAQGFQRRESNTAKLAYEYETQPDEAETHLQGLQTQLASNDNNSAQSKSTAVGKVTTAEVFKAPQTEKKQIVEKNVAAPPVKTGLVSGRAAVFEHKAAINQQQQQQQQQQQRSQKDPTELSLKERMQLFERNKGNALMPKAAFGMAPSINKIRQENANIRKEPMKVSAPSGSSAPTVNVHKPSGDSGVRNKVAALVANATTISENKIKADIQKQRQEDMQILANRFNKQKEIFAKEQEEQQQKELELKAQTSQQSTVQTKQTVDATKNSSSLRQPAPPPPPPPPMPTHSATNSPMNTLTAKRRSPGDSIDDESKRARKSNNAIITERTRLYPALSDLESNESFNCGTTATPPHSDGARADDHDEDDVASQDDDNCNDSYMDSEEDSSACLGNNSLGREVLQVVKQNEQQQNPTQNKVINKQFKEVHYADKDLYYGGDSSMNSSEASMGVDDYLNEAMDENIEDGDDDCTQESDDGDENNSRASRGSKGTTASNSFSFRKTPKRFSNCHPISEENDNYQTPITATTRSSSTQQPVKSELCVNREDDNMVTLVHTVSFYRKQKNANSNNSTPVRRICREEQVFRSTPMSGSPASAQMEFEAQQQRDDYSNDEDSQSDGDLVDKSHLVQEKIKKLLDEVCKQQQVIAQTSQALNLCAATIEFSGSTESVEGERHLLVATHRRQACLDEVQRLRVEKSLRPIGAPKEKGRLTVKEIILPLRQEYIRKLAADTISGHHLVCLLKYNEHVLATKTVPTLPGLLAVKFPDVLQLNNVYADFRITLEIYGMTAQREVLPHEVKYHINLNKKTGIKTPKKKGADNRLVMPPVQSPAGPNVVRTPALVQHGFAIFSLREIQRTTWTLTQVLGFSPLDGAVHMKVNCELSVSVEYKGFLTMFEDVSGFGAWHRRWCYLSGTMLNFWKYPDDETKKTPIGSIDLYTCSSQKVTLAPRDICARLNTMLLECQRPALDTDKESLIIVPNGRTTTVRYLLSADTKEEREEWCAYFNKALTLLRAWGPPQ